MSEVIPILGALGGGLGLGAFYFGGLWLTVRRLPSAKHPHLLSLGSFLARMSVTAPGFYWVMDGRWDRVVACLLGFLAARSMSVRLWGPGVSLKNGTL